MILLAHGNWWQGKVSITDICRELCSTCTRYSLSSLSHFYPQMLLVYYSQSWEGTITQLSINWQTANHVVYSHWRAGSSDMLQHAWPSKQGAERSPTQKPTSHVTSFIRKVRTKESTQKVDEGEGVWDKREKGTRALSTQCMKEGFSRVVKMFPSWKLWSCVEWTVLHCTL